MVKYTIKLTKDEVSELTAIVSKGSHSSQSYRAAHVLLSVDEGEHSRGKSSNQEISRVLKIDMRTIDRIKKKCFEGGIDKALERAESAQVRKRKLDGDLEARIVQLCCSEPPEGFARWSLRLLAGKAVELGYVGYISHVSIREVLKKTNSSLGG